MLAGCLIDAAIAGAAVPCEEHSLAFGDAKAGWKHRPLSKLKRDTVYAVVRDGSGRSVLRATADGAASLYGALLTPMASASVWLSWRWKTDALVPGADNRDKSREDAPLRVMAFFDGDVATLPADEQTRFRRAKRIAGRDPPFATLMYVWTDHVPVGTIIPSAHTSQLKLIAVASGPAGLGNWQSVTRRLADDYRHAFGASPGPLLGVAVMTDSDNTGAKAVGEYTDVRIGCAGG